MTDAPILMVCPHLPPQYQGGIEIHSEWLIRLLSRRLHSLIVVYLAPPSRNSASRGTVRKRHHDNVLYIEISIDERHMGRPDTYFFNDVIHDTILAAIDSYRPRAMLVQGGFRITSSAALAARRRQIPHTIVLHDFFYFCPKVNLLDNRGSRCEGNVSIDACVECLSAKCDISHETMEDWMCDRRVAAALPKLVGSYRSVASAALHSANNLLTPSQYIRGKHIQRYPGVTPVTLRLGVPATYRPLSRRARRPPKFAYIGHLHPHKGVHVLLDALELLADTDRSPSVKIYGHLAPDSHYHEQLRQRCARLKNAGLRGAYRFSELEMILNDVDVVVVPSIWQENSPLVIMVALRSGIPVIASNVGGIPEMIIDGWNGILVDPGNSTQLAAAISHLVEDADALDFIAGNATYPRTTEDEISELLRVL
jgi:glycosyltransferase involved in cell wall biosynthesis